MAEFYPYSRQEAKDSGELHLWRDSHKANISCAKHISGLIETHAEQGRLEADAAQSALSQWGFRRVQFVLANTLIATGGLGFEPDSLRWARWRSSSSRPTPNTCGQGCSARSTAGHPVRISPGRW